MIYVFVDPSGSYNEGKGHTGIASIIGEDWTTLEYTSIDAKKYDNRHDYWKAIKDYILNKAHSRSEPHVVIESFQIRSTGFLIGKMPETILLIGMLEYTLEHYHIPYTTQAPTTAKSRFKDEDLPHFIPDLELRSNGRYYLKNKQINDHVRDALKHLLYFMKYRKDKLYGK